MNKTSVYLSSEDTTRLAALAKREGTSQAEVIRRAIKNYEPERRGDRNFALAGVSTGDGGSVASLTDEELMKGFGA
jgi:predicted DNA-binding protein